jgi:hypothetical protein
MKKQSALIEAVKAKMAYYNGYAMPAACAPLVLIVKASKFERAQLAAMSLAFQRKELKEARNWLKRGNVDMAKALLSSWRCERQSYNLLFSI